MTLEVKQKLQTELDALETELRVELPKEIKRAREFGDLRENSEYQTALQRQTMVKARIRELRQRLSADLCEIVGAAAARTVFEMRSEIGKLLG